MNVARIGICAASLAGALAGCGGERAVNNQAARISMKNDAHDSLLAASPGGQRLAMWRAIRDSGIRCLRVDNAGYQEEYKNLRMWVAVCGEERKSFAIFVAPNEDIQVRDCADAGTLSLPRCQGLPPPVADPNEPQIKEGASDEAFRNTN